MTGATPLYGRVALIGLGLIAGSMAHAMRAGGLAAEIVGHAKSAETREVARALFCDRVCDSAAEAVKGRIWWSWPCRWARWAPSPPRSRRT